MRFTLRLRGKSSAAGIGAMEGVQRVIAGMAGKKWKWDTHESTGDRTDCEVHRTVARTSKWDIRSARQHLTFRFLLETQQRDDPADIVSFDLTKPFVRD